MIMITLAVFVITVTKSLIPIIMMVPLIIVHMAVSYLLNTAYGINGLAMATNITYFVGLVGILTFTIVSKDEQL